MNKTLHIITPVSRPENLDQIANSIDLSKSGFIWHLVLDASIVNDEKIKVYNKWAINHPNVCVHNSPIEKALAGHAHRNWMITKLQLFSNSEKIDWIYFLDDDTLLHYDFLNVMETKLNPDKTAFIFHQNLKGDVTRLIANINNVRVCQIDMGQYVFNLQKLPKGLYFKEDNYCADGIFIETLFEKSGMEQFKVIDQVLSYYNYLRD